MDSFEKIVQEALQLDFAGWDFSSIRDRWYEHDEPWDYRDYVLAQLPHSQAMLDMGTGGGEFLSSLGKLPAHTCASENYAPNVPIAKARLEPLGVTIKAFEEDSVLPFVDGEFDLIINRHESFDPQEVRRLLRKNGRFLTQQVGGKDNVRLNELIEGKDKLAYDAWGLMHVIEQLEEANFEIVDAQEAFPDTEWFDVGAVVFYLKAIPWQIEDFAVEKYESQLRAVHELIQKEGKLVTSHHRFYVECIKH